VVVFICAVAVSVLVPRNAGLAGLALTSALNLTGTLAWMVRQTTELEVNMNSGEKGGFCGAVVGACVFTRSSASFLAPRTQFEHAQTISPYTVDFSADVDGAADDRAGGEDELRWGLKIVHLVLSDG
jgi:hypothetical protein